MLLNTGCSSKIFSKVAVSMVLLPLRFFVGRLTRNDGFSARQLLEGLLTELFLGNFLRHQPQGHRHPVKDGFRAGRTPRDVKINGNYSVCASHHVVSVEPAAASRRTRADSQRKLRSEERRVGKECRSRWS